MTLILIIVKKNVYLNTKVHPRRDMTYKTPRGPTQVTLHTFHKIIDKSKESHIKKNSWTFQSGSLT